MRWAGATADDDPFAVVVAAGEVVNVTVPLGRSLSSVKSGQFRAYSRLRRLLGGAHNPSEAIDADP